MSTCHGLDPGAGHWACSNKQKTQNTHILAQESCNTQDPMSGGTSTGRRDRERGQEVCVLGEARVAVELNFRPTGQRTKKGRESPAGGESPRPWNMCKGPGAGLCLTRSRCSLCRVRGVGMGRQRESRVVMGTRVRGPFLNGTPVEGSEQRWGRSDHVPSGCWVGNRLKEPEARDQFPQEPWREQRATVSGI